MLDLINALLVYTMGNILNMVIQIVILVIAVGALVIAIRALKNDRMNATKALKNDRAAATDDLKYEINGDAGPATYDTQLISGVGAVVAAARSAANPWIYCIANTAGANEFGSAIFTFSDYAKADRHKHYTILNGMVEDRIYLISGRWENTDPITQIVLTPAVGPNLMAGSVFELVGLMPSDIFTIEVDNVLEAFNAAQGATVTDNTEDWEYVTNDVMPYV